MSSPLNSSFIPKKSPKQGQKTTSPRSIFVGTLIVRIFFFAILISTVVVLFYEKNLNNDLVDKKNTYSEAVKNFDKNSFENIKAMSNRLHQVRNRLDYTVSFDSIFNLLEASTLGTVQINNLNIKKVDDSKLTLDVNMKTDSFDAIVFQRMVFGGGNVTTLDDGTGFEVTSGESDLKVIDVTDLSINNPRVDSKTNQTLESFSVSFKADLALDSLAVPHQISENTSLNNSVDDFDEEVEEVSEEEVFPEDSLEDNLNLDN